VFAYGQSGTGKTFTMAGIKPSPENNFTEELLGLKPRMIRRVFELRDQQKVQFDYEITSYMVEIYLNRLEDLYWKIDAKREAKGKKSSPEPPELKVRVDAKKRVTIDGVVIKKFESAEELLGYMDEAEETRRTRRTGLNEASSRSHLVFAMMIEQTDRKTGRKLKGKLSLVDLAGSERADKTNVDGLSKAQRDSMMEEGVAINESLRMLKNVFRILGTQNLPVPKGQKPEIVQYRGNMLTELMQDSLGGAAKTLMFTNVGCAASNISETIDSLQYGDYVKNITNEKVSADEDFTEVIRRLKADLQAYQTKYGEL
jgi:kinesin family protein C2/C3